MLGDVVLAPYFYGTTVSGLMGSPPCCTVAACPNAYQTRAHDASALHPPRVHLFLARRVAREQLGDEKLETDLAAVDRRLRGVQVPRRQAASDAKSARRMRSPSRVRRRPRRWSHRGARGCPFALDVLTGRPMRAAVAPGDLRPLAVASSVVLRLLRVLRHFRVLRDLAARSVLLARMRALLSAAGCRRRRRRRPTRGAMDMTPDLDVARSHVVVDPELMAQRLPQNREEGLDMLWLQSDD